MPHKQAISIHFFKPGHSHPDPQSEDAKGSHVMRVIAMGWNHAAAQKDQLASVEMFKAIFIKRNPRFLKGFRNAFRTGFHHLYEQLHQLTPTEEQLEQTQLYLNHCLSLLPFADIAPHHQFTIPQYINNQWHPVKYRVTPIELTPTAGVEAVFIGEEDRVFAYGLEPIDHDQAEPHLIFMGTTYPAGQGSITQIDTDLHWFNTPGNKLYRTGRKAITAWLDHQIANNKKTHVCGISLGGSLSLLLAMDQGEKLSRVDAINPPGIYEKKNKNPFDHWDSCLDQPTVIVQKNADDVVSAFGTWKKEWNIIHVRPHADKKGPNGYTDHILNYAGFADTQFIHVNAEDDNQSRKVRNFWIYGVLRNLVYGLLFLPYRYFLLPTARFAWNNKFVLLTLGALCATIPLVPPLMATILMSVTIAASALLLIYQIVKIANIILGKTTVHPPECHKTPLEKKDALETDQKWTQVSCS